MKSSLYCALHRMLFLEALGSLQLVLKDTEYYLDLELWIHSFIYYFTSKASYGLNQSVLSSTLVSALIMAQMSPDTGSTEVLQY